MKIARLKEQINEMNKAIKLLEQELSTEDTVEVSIFKIYLREESVTAVAQIINAMGYRKISQYTGKEVKYTSTDVSEILKDKRAAVEHELKEVVGKIVRNHHKNGSR